MDFRTDVPERDTEKIIFHIEQSSAYESCERIVRHALSELTGSYKLRLVSPQNLLDYDRLIVYHIEVIQGDGSVLEKRLPYTDFLEWPGWSRKRTRRLRGVIVLDWESNS